jgi:hypothetical protein
MKKLAIVCIALATLAACDNQTTEETTSTDSLAGTDNSVVSTTVMEGPYTDLSTGQTVELRKDEKTGYVVYVATGEPIDFYIDMNTLDTFFGRSGTVVNNMILYTDENRYMLDDAEVKWDGEELKILGADGSKEKLEGDEYKSKSADGSKVKQDGDEYKVKTSDGTKVKEEDGKVKVK